VRLFIGIALGLVLTIGWITLEFVRHRSPTTTTEVFSSEESLGPVGKKTHLQVYKIVKESTGLFDPQDIRSTRIELTGEFRGTLSLPPEIDLAAQSAQVVDLNRDGTKEILVYRDNLAVGVVWLRDGKLIFRPDKDFLKSWGFDVGPQLTDGRAVFTAASEFPPGSIEAVPRPRLFSWTQQQGFIDVTSQNSAYVVRHLIPVLKDALQAQQNEARRQNFRNVIAELSDSAK
jgi:hypothetical protein